eukprot:CAMPEP_0118644182 /NCGR_PEP_ID=MMETSP0785-20121206/6799_1 /TAXON_ID=91992 /ORGANISM="Bolidomonas pacifica, Strain CCMP 1866" /LENGTH=241 /DNA_ID=CAMNT_0006535917 /DNA_START=53 /DNA_END=779 /DNA_ORIENTATION=+
MQANHLASASPRDVNENTSRRISLSSDHLCLYHNHVDGKRVIKINNKEVHSSRKGFDNGSVHNITHNGTTYVVKIRAKLTGGFEYTCSLNNKALKSHLERPAVVQEDLNFAVTGCQVDQIMGSPSHSGSGAPPPSKPESVGVYHVEVMSKEAGMSIANSDHRFSEFAELYETIRMMYGGTHLGKNIPAPPGKKLKISTDHLSQKFLEERRQQLDEFMKKLGSFPGIMGVPGIQSFLGFDSV